MGLWYTKDFGFKLTGFSDADYAGWKDTFKSTSGGAQFLGEKMEHVEKGTIELYFVKTDYQLADLFTKALPVDQFNYLVCHLGMRSLSPKELERLAKSCQNRRDLPRNTPLDRVEVLGSLSRWYQLLVHVELGFKTSCSINKDKYMMKAQAHVSKSSAISDVQALPQKNIFDKIAVQ
ncbi:hypothetical protein Tco_0409795 [Tanacetum coccineum]